MNKLYAFVIMALLLVSGAFATTGIFTDNNRDKNNNPSFDKEYKQYYESNSNKIFCNNNDNDNNGFKNECQNFYNDTKYYTIAKWEFSHRNYYLTEKNKVYKYYATSVKGDLKSAHWISTPDVYSVLVKAGNNRLEFDGGASGSVTSSKDISHITFCGYKNDGHDEGCTGANCNGVPEYSTLTIGLAVIAVLLGLVFLRKK